MNPQLYSSYSDEPTQRLFAAVIEQSADPLFKPTPAWPTPLPAISPHIYIGREFRTRKVAVEVETTVLLGDVLETLTLTEYNLYPAGSLPEKCVCATHEHGQHRANRATRGSRSADKHFITIQGRLYRRGTATRPPRRVLDTSRHHAIQQAHGQCGHRGRDPTYWRLSQQFYWEGMFNDVAQYVHACTGCRLRADATPAHPNEMEWNVFNVQIHSMPPSSHGQFLLHAYDPLLEVHAAMASHTDSADALAHFLQEEVIRRYGTACSFVGLSFKEIKAAVRILRGRFGRAVRVDPHILHPDPHIVHCLSRCAHRRPETWPFFVPAVVLALGCTASRMTGYAPESSLYGTQADFRYDYDDPCWKIVPWRDSVSDTLALIACKAEQIVRVVSGPQVSRQTRARRAPKLHRARPANILAQFHDFVPGIWVLKHDPAVRREPEDVDQDMYTGPYIIREELPDARFRLSECDGTIIATPVHAERLTAYIGDMPNEIYASLFDDDANSFDDLYQAFDDRYSAYTDSLPPKLVSCLFPYITEITATAPSTSIYSQ